MCEDDDELITTERIGLTVWLLLCWNEERDGPPTAATLAGRVGIASDGMGRMLNKLSRVIPVYRSGGGWYIRPAKRPSGPVASGRLVET